MKISALALIVAAGMMSACESTTKLPVSRDVLELRMSTDELVCHVRNVSNVQGLSFHYGTSQQSFGSMATFRLIGDRIEIILVNDQQPFEFHLTAYDMSDSGVARRRAEQAFTAFKSALMKQPNEECRR